MPSVLDRCPEEVANTNMWLDAIVASVPYGNQSSVTVEVPPLVWQDSDVLDSVRSDQPDDHTPWDMKEPEKTHVGWDSDDEKAEAAEIIDRANEIIELGQQGKLHPDAQADVMALANAAKEEMEDVRAQYQRWADARLVAKYSDSPFSAYQVYEGAAPLSLDQSVSAIKLWAQWPTSGTETRDYFEAFSSLLEGETGGWEMLDPKVSEWWTALSAARRRDRERIRGHFMLALKALHCADYGVAQSESYYGNKKAAGPQIGGTGGGEPLPKFKLAKVVPIEPETPPLQATPVPVDPGPKPEAPTEPAPEQATPWYQTPGGKVALAVAGVAVAGGAGYGIYRLMQRRRMAAAPF